MLKLLSRKLCPFLSLAVATVGCGKKLTEPKTQPVQVVENQELPTTISIELNTSVSAKAQFKIPQNGWFNLPEKLIVNDGSAIGKEVEISYNVDAEIEEDYEFVCTYTSTGSSSELQLSTCKDSYGGNFGNVMGNVFPMDEGKLIEVRLTTPSSKDLVLNAIYSVVWK
ncbi:MAG TPA: hypothetical protein VNJ01_03905 [Bacteriovoracaceae bacterium]|nr:hypothetical protein [Bacteriovoracaceae bacterium]